MGQVYLFGGAMRFLARDQVSNVLASRGPRYRLVCRATASREKKLDPSFRATDGLREAKFYFLFAKKTTSSRTVTRDFVLRSFAFGRQSSRVLHANFPRTRSKSSTRARPLSAEGFNFALPVMLFIFLPCGEINTRRNARPTFFHDAIKFPPQPPLCREKM